jgi:hypothetical protein
MPSPVPADRATGRRQRASIDKSLQRAARSASIERGTNGSSCRDLKFFVGFVNFDDLGRQRADELNSIPTRFKMAPQTVDLVIGAGRDALQANATFQAFLSHP